MVCGKAGTGIEKLLLYDVEHHRDMAITRPKKKLPKWFSKLCFTRTIQMENIFHEQLKMVLQNAFIITIVLFLVLNNNRFCRVRKIFIRDERKQ